ncbi:MAG: hypothetical protein HYT79_04695 [Elusimicrobia bacterium]|nr:hypothetical protein [Elusimicrobiota bacterium]
MNRRTINSASIFIFGALVTGFLLGTSYAADAKGKTKAKKEEGSSFEAEKAKALAQPYANDMTWMTADERNQFVKDYEEKHLKAYPDVHKKAFAAMKLKCAKCHEVVRPLNSQFFEPDGKDVAERNKKVADLKKSQPALFQDKNVLQPEGDIWQRYVKRMMAKPGCEISKDEGKQIWNFLVYDSVQRKIGAKKDEWQAHRKGLLAKFKEKHPARFSELYGGAHDKEKASKGGK